MLKVQLYVWVKVRKDELYGSFTAALRNSKVAISCCDIRDVEIKAILIQEGDALFTQPKSTHLDRMLPEAA